MLRKFALILALAALAATPAASEQRPDLPGRAAKLTKTIVFNVAAAHSGEGIHGAIVSCELRQATKRKRTDRTGTAPLSFTFSVGSSRGSLATECVVSKAGFSPEFEVVDLARQPQTQFVRVNLTPRL